MSAGPVRVGLVGTGMISDAYLTNLIRFPDTGVIILGDLGSARATARAEEHGLPEADAAENARGLGVLDMARAIRADRRPHIASGEPGYHVLDTLVAIDESIATR